jgi:hypothetical protein
MHKPLEFATSLSAKLATRSRHVCAFLGAGVARACNLPDVAQLQGQVLSALGDDDKAAFQRQLEGRNLEQVLSRLRRIAALLAGEETVDGLTASNATALDTAVCQAIVDALDIARADLRPILYLACWCARADYRLPLELFTVNYDLLIETALEKIGVPYFDGFVGALRAKFRTEIVEDLPGSDGEKLPPFFVRFWKLHGSVNWAWQDREIVRLGQPVPNELAAAIYPSDAKYEESRRVPFVVLQDRLRRALYQPETLMIISGYSFSDAHLNDLLFDAARRRERSEFVAFCHSEIPNDLAQFASETPNFQVACGREAILGGVRAEWKPPEEPPPNLWEDGQLALRDFRNLAAYLARSASREPVGEAMIQKLLQECVLNQGAEVDGEGHV